MLCTFGIRDSFKRRYEKAPPPSPNCVALCALSKVGRLILIREKLSNGITGLKKHFEVFHSKISKSAVLYLKKAVVKCVFLLCAELFQRQRAFFNNNSPVYLQEYLPRVLYCEFVPLELDMNLRVYLGVLEKT